jgi:hypothetical protein
LKTKAVIEFEHVLDEEEVHIYNELPAEVRLEYLRMMEEGLTEHLREVANSSDIITAKVIFEEESE